MADVKTDFQKIMEVMESVGNSHYKRVIGLVADTTIVLDCSLWRRNIEFHFETGKLKYVRVADRGCLCAQVEWSGILVGAMFKDEYLHLYQDGNGYMRIHLEKGELYAK